MTATEGRTEEGVFLDAFTLEIIGFLQTVFDAIENGTEDQLYSDPFSDSGLSDEKVDELIEEIDKEFAQEIGTYRDYHRNRSGAEATPDFHRLGRSARRAVAEEMLRICERHPT